MLLGYFVLAVIAWAATLEPRLRSCTAAAAAASAVGMVMLYPACIQSCDHMLKVFYAEADKNKHHGPTMQETQTTSRPKTSG